MKELRWLLDFINESIGQRPIASISAQEHLVMLRKLESKGRYETARRLRSTDSQICWLRHRHGLRSARRGGGSARRLDRGIRGASQHPRGAATVAACVRPAGRAAPRQVVRLRLRQLLSSRIDWGHPYGSG